MTHAAGTYLGGCRTLSDLRARCRVDSGDSPCWHLLTARGAPMPRTTRHTIWVYGRGLVTSLRAAYEFAFGPQDLTGRVVYRVAHCPSYDCVAPHHIRRGTRQQMLAEQVARGTHRTPAKLRANLATGLRRSRVSAELRQWLVESTQPGTVLAPVLGMSHGHISQLRRQMRGAVA